jgi:hypothetical protein
MFAFNRKSVGRTPAQPVICGLGALLMMAGIGHGGLVHAQTTPPLRFQLGFYLVDPNNPRSCTTANGKVKIDGEVMEVDKKGKLKSRKVKLDIAFENGQMTAKDPDGLLRNANSDVYGSFYYLEANLSGNLKVQLERSKIKTALIDVNLDSFRTIPGTQLFDQDQFVPERQEYIDFAIPCP